MIVETIQGNLVDFTSLEFKLQFANRHRFRLTVVLLTKLNSIERLRDALRAKQTKV